MEFLQLVTVIYNEGKGNKKKSKKRKEKKTAIASINWAWAKQSTHEYILFRNPKNALLHRSTNYVFYTGFNLGFKNQSSSVPQIQFGPFSLHAPPPRVNFPCLCHRYKISRIWTCRVKIAEELCHKLEQMSSKLCRSVKWRPLKLETFFLVKIGKKKI